MFINRRNIVKVMINIQDLQRVRDSRLVEECHELVFHHGENIGGRGPLEKRFTFPDEGLTILFYGRYGGECDLGVYRTDEEGLGDCLLHVSGESISDTDVRGGDLVRVEDGKMVYFLSEHSLYVPVQWEQRVHDVYHGLQLANKKLEVPVPVAG